MELSKADCKLLIDSFFVTSELLELKVWELENLLIAMWPKLIDRSISFFLGKMGMCKMVDYYFNNVHKN